MMATSKLAQTAKGTRRCEACGRTKDLSAFGLHGRWGTPMRKCLTCMADIRRQAGAKKAKTHAKAREKQAKAEVRALTKKARETESAAVVWAKLDGYALAMHDGGALAGLLNDLRKMIAVRINTNDNTKET